MLKHINSLFILALLFGGCAKTNIDYNALRNDQKSTVKTFASLKPQKLEDDKTFTAKLGDDHKEVIMIKEQRAFASKLLPPKMSAPFSLDISSSSMVGFFAPKILFLDAKNKVVRTTEAKDLQFDRGFFKGTVFVNTGYEKIHSIVVTQDLKELHKKHNINYVTATPIMIAAGPVMINYVSSSGDQNKTIQNAYGGNVRLALHEYKPAILGEENK